MVMVYKKTIKQEVVYEADIFSKGEVGREWDLGMILNSCLVYSQAKPYYIFFRKKKLKDNTRIVWANLVWATMNRPDEEICRLSVDGKKESQSDIFSIDGESFRIGIYGNYLRIEK